jgi:hypothetical protein
MNEPIENKELAKRICHCCSDVEQEVDEKTDFGRKQRLTRKRGGTYESAERKRHIQNASDLRPRGGRRLRAPWRIFHFRRVQNAPWAL